jgi:regulator of replication initiation timing
MPEASKKKVAWSNHINVRYYAKSPKHMTPKKFIELVNQNAKLRYENSALKRLVRIQKLREKKRKLENKQLRSKFKKNVR